MKTETNKDLNSSIQTQHRMAPVTVGIDRNTFWSLRFNAQTNVIFSNTQTIHYDTLKNQVRKFSEQTQFKVGHLLIEKQEDGWILTFPGISLSFTEWIVSENSSTPIRMQVNISNESLQTLLEFLIHMKEHGQIV